MRAMWPYAINLIRSPLLWCGLIALALSNPQISFGFVILTMAVGTIPLGVMAVWTLAAPVFVAGGWMLERVGLAKDWPFAALATSAICCLMIHLGFSAGLSRWGFASSMGGKNIPYEEAVLWPLQMFKVLLGL